MAGVIQLSSYKENKHNYVGTAQRMTVEESISSTLLKKYFIIKPFSYSYYLRDFILYTDQPTIWEEIIESIQISVAGSNQEIGTFQPKMDIAKYGNSGSKAFYHIKWIEHLKGFLVGNDPFEYRIIVTLRETMNQIRLTCLDVFINARYTDFTLERVQIIETPIYLHVNCNIGQNKIIIPTDKIIEIYIHCNGFVPTKIGLMNQKYILSPQDPIIHREITPYMQGMVLMENCYYITYRQHPFVQNKFKYEKLKNDVEIHGYLDAKQMEDLHLLIETEICGEANIIVVVNRELCYEPNRITVS